MTHDEFIAEYYKVSARAIEFSEKARREGLLALENVIDYDKVNQRDIFEYGLSLTVDGTDSSILIEILENIIKQEEDKYTHLLMEIKMAAVISIQIGDNPRITAVKLNSFTNLALPDDPITRKTNEKDARGKFTEDEIDSLIEGKN